MANFQTTHTRRMRRFNLLLVLLFVGGIVAICGFSLYVTLDSIQGERNEPKTNMEGIRIETLVEFEDKKAYPEALTIAADGSLYSGSYCTGEIWKITTDGAMETYLQADSGVGAASGMAFSPSGDLYVIDRENCDPRKSVSKIKKITPDGTVTDFGDIPDTELLNSLAFAPDGTLYATDTQLGEVRFYTPDGTGATWWELPEPRENARPTGLEYDPVHHALVVADSSNGVVYRVVIGEDGKPGDITEIYEQRERELDGLTVDDEGNVIFTIYDSNQVAMVDEMGLFTVLAEDFREPSDVAYLDGKVYVTNFDGVSLAPLVSMIVDPSLPFTIDVIDMTEFENAR